MDRFDRQRRIAGWDQARIERARVLVCGRGWVGTFTVWGLASLGVGEILWVGRPDNGSVPGISGALTAAPLLFEAFERSGLELAPFPRAPAGAIRLSASQLPPPLASFDRRAIFSGVGRLGPANRLHIAFPIDGALMEAAVDSAGETVPVVIKLQGGTPPFRLLADGRPVSDASRKRQLLWTPQGPGTARLTVLDGAGQASNVSVVMR